MKKVWKLAALFIGVALMAGCSAANSTDKTGEALETYFFDYALESVEVADTYGEQTAAEGNKLLLVQYKVKNTFGEKLSMYDDDFQVQWGEGDEDYANAITAFDDVMMPYTYDLDANEETVYFQVFEVPEEVTAFTLAYLELFENGTTGEFYEILFTAE